MIIIFLIILNGFKTSAFNIRRYCPIGQECVEIPKCPDACDLIEGGLTNLTSRRMLNEITCDVRKVPSVCCDQDKISTIDHCLSCGKTIHMITPLCTGCQDVRPGERPWTVILKYQNQDDILGLRSLDHDDIYDVDQNDVNDVTRCSGTLVSSKHVITAAHCLKDGTIESVVLGETNITAAYEDCFKKGRCADEVMNVKVKSAEIHPDYINEDVPIHDVAILTLDSHVKFSRFIQPLCLPKKPVTGKLSKLSISGWGNAVDARTLNKPKSSELLQYLDVQYVNNNQCSKMWNKEFTESHMCIESKESGKSPCQGDSGGPVSRIIYQDSVIIQRELVGVISFGAKQCGTPKPTVVSRFDRLTLAWIKSIVPDVTLMR